MRRTDVDLFVPLEPVPADHALLGVIREPARGPRAVWLLYRNADGDEYGTAGLITAELNPLIIAPQR